MTKLNLNYIQNNNMLIFLEKYKKFIIYYPLAAYWILIFTLTSLPAVRVPKTGINDKIEHFLAFGGLGFLLRLAFQFQRKIERFHKKPLLFIIIIGALYAMTDELHQLLVPGRFCDVRDWAADMIGIIGGALIAGLVIRYLTFKQGK